MSAQGIDISSYQSPLSSTGIGSYDFLFVKASDGGPMSTDPHFASNWATLKSHGKVRGAYHELSGSSPGSQAALFMAAVTSEGLEDGDMLVVVCSDYPEVDGAKVQSFVNDVEAALAAAKKNCPVIIYSDLSFLPNLGAVKNYPLWLAYYNSTPPKSVAPFKTWTFWQWSDSPEDQDAYNGDAAHLTSWINTYKNKPAPTPVPVVSYVPAATQEAIMAALPIVQNGSSDKKLSHQYVRRVQAIVYEIYGHKTTDAAGVFGSSTETAVKEVQKAAKLTQDGIVGPKTWSVLITGS